MAAADTARLIAALELQDRFSATAQKFDRTVGGMERRTSTLGRLGEQTSRGLANTARNVATIGVFAGGAAVALVGKSIQDASQLEQAVGAVNSVFGKSQDVINEWGKVAAEQAGLSQRAVKEMGAVIGAQLQGMGFELDDSSEKTVLLEKRAADMAATFGGTTAEAVQAISSLMRGERDPIEKYGVSIKQADIAARVAAKGLDTSTTAAKKNSEAIAALELLLEATAKTEGQFARESDSLAGAQQRLSAKLENTRALIGNALLPVMSKLADQGATAAITDHMPEIEAFAAELPGIFNNLLGIVERLPWDAIGTSFKLMGQGAKAALEFFAGLPPWVQTAVLTGWGLNKLTGGALGGIVGELGKGLIKGVLGMNAGVVNINAATVNGGAGGVPGVGGKGGGGLIGGLKTGAAIAAPLLVGVAAVEVVNFQNMRNEATGFLEGKLDSLDRNTRDGVNASIDKIQAQIDMERPFLEGVLFNTNVKPVLEQELEQLRQVRTNLIAANQHDATLIDTARRQAQEQATAVALARSAGTADQNLLSTARSQVSRQAEALAAARAGNSTLAAIRDKRSTVNVTVNATTNVSLSASQVALRVAQAHQTINGRTDIGTNVG